MQAFVYIMANHKNGTLYIGVTTDLGRRVYEHKTGMIAGFTKRYGLKTLVYAESHSRIDEAIAREKAMKAWQRAWKISLIEATNPHWDDVLDHWLGGVA